MSLVIGDAGQTANAPVAVRTPILKVVPTVVPTPVPAPVGTDTVQLSEAAEIKFLHAQGADQTQINAKLGLSVAGVEPELVHD
jgi:hypothetical protein